MERANVCKIPCIELVHGCNQGLKIPQVGFGCYKLKKKNVVAPLRHAYDSGYRLVDTAQVYQNEKEVGMALEDAAEDIFLITKLWRSHVSNNESDIQGRLKDHKMALKRRITLWMMHWPGPGRNPQTKHCSPSNWSPSMRVSSFRAMANCWKRGEVDAIGVSNFSIRQIEELEKGLFLPSFRSVSLIFYHCLRRNRGASSCERN